MGDVPHRKGMEKMKDESLDRLTKLKSDTTLEEIMYFELRRAERYKCPLSFLLMEPKIGEPEGDELIYSVLKIIAGFIRKHTRFVDISVRIGRQLLIILTETPPEKAEVVKNKLKTLIEEKPLEVGEEYPQVSVKLLVALASFPEDGRDGKTILKILQDKINQEYQST